MVNLLLEAGADALIRNAKGWAPAQSAAAGGHLDIVLRLVAAGACPRSKPELDVLRMLARKTSYKCASALLLCPPAVTVCHVTLSPLQDYVPLYCRKPIAL